MSDLILVLLIPMVMITVPAFVLAAFDLMTEVKS